MWLCVRSHSRPAARRWLSYSPLPPPVVYNSLTNTLTPLLPDNLPATGLTWYNCGPTVYDSAHLGHARTYVTLDILRRVVTKYFGTPVFAAMGMTDVDDKILARAGERVRAHTASMCICSSFRGSL